MGVCEGVLTLLTAKYKTFTITIIKKMVYIFLIYSINVYIYTVSSVSKGVKRQCRMYVQPAGQTVSNLFGICGLNFSADGRQMTNRGPLGGLVWSERELP